MHAPATHVAQCALGTKRFWEHLEVTPQRPVVEGAVYTFNVSPDSVYGKGCGYTFDTFGILTLKKSFEDWRLRVENPMVPME